MGLLKRLLGGPGCGNSRRFVKSGRLGGASRRHVESCPVCRARQQRERQYLERLRGAAVPQASDDLTSRLLARTQELAAERHAADLSALPPLQPGLSRPRARIPAVVAGGAAAAMALMAGAAYLMGGAPAPLADGADAAAFLRPVAGSDAVGPTAAGNPGKDAAPGVGAGWTLTGTPDLTPGGALSAGQLETLRSHGWACPDLRELGFHMIWARGEVAAGGNVLELRLTDGQHFVTVLEQHGSPLPAHGVAGAQQPGAPVNVLTGHPATADGFTAAGPGGTTGSPASGSGTLWINAAAPFRAIYQASGATFTYIADLPADQAGDGVAALLKTGAGTALTAPGSRPGGRTGSPNGWSGAWAGSSNSWHRDRRTGRQPTLPGQPGIVACPIERVIFLKCLESTDRSFSFC